jgi:hypothetical protein
MSLIDTVNDSGSSKVQVDTVNIIDNQPPFVWASAGFWPALMARLHLDRFL